MCVTWQLPLRPDFHLSDVRLRELLAQYLLQLSFKGSGVPTSAFHHHASRVGVTDETYRCGLAAAEPLREGGNRVAQGADLD